MKKCDMYMKVTDVGIISERYSTGLLRFLGFENPKKIPRKIAKTKRSVDIPYGYIFPEENTERTIEKNDMESINFANAS